MLKIDMVVCALTVLECTLISKRRLPFGNDIESNQRTPFEKHTSDVVEDAIQDTPGLVKKYGYPIEVHNVVTHDGYILEIHRIPHGRHNDNPGSRIRPVAFLIHGFLSSSADYVLSGPGRALAYILAEEGYDVWLGNDRGNYYSRRHVKLNPDRDIEFWMFSFDEMGYYDLKACTDYVLNVTGNNKLHYIGHSQGGATFMAFTSLRPEYNKNIISFQSLAPATFLSNTDSLFFNTASLFGRIIEPIAYLLNVPEFLPRTELLNWIGRNFCGDESKFQSLCYILFGRNDDIRHFNETLLPVYLGHSPAGASIRQVVHYTQIINSGKFRRYDFGIGQNIRHYNEITPPEYNLSLVTAPVYLHYSVGDMDVNYKDVFLLGSKLPNLVGIYRVERSTFHHMDFLWGVDAKEMIYDKVIALMRKAETVAGYI